MGLVISSALVAPPAGVAFSLDNPIIGYQTLVNSGNVAVTTQNADFPVVNLGNSSTYLRWESVPASPPADDYITITPGSSLDIDYLAIARHNFASNLTPVSVEGLAMAGSPENWVELVSERLLPSDAPTVFRFAKQSLYAIRLRIKPSQAAEPQPSKLAVLYAGALLTLQRRIYVGHTPLIYGRETRLANHRSINGNFLGRIVLSEKRQSSVSIENMTPDWYRSQLDPFIIAAQKEPFFFAWRPSSYPDEAGFAWLTDSPQPQNQLSNGMMSISFEMEGIA